MSPCQEQETWGLGFLAHPVLHSMPSMLKA